MPINDGTRSSGKRLRRRARLCRPTPQLRELALTYRVRRDIRGDAIRLGGTITDANHTVKVLLAILGDESSEVFGLLGITPWQRVIG